MRQSPSKVRWPRLLSFIWSQRAPSSPWTLKRIHLLLLRVIISEVASHITTSSSIMKAAIIKEDLKSNTGEMKANHSKRIINASQTTSRTVMMNLRSLILRRGSTIEVDLLAGLLHTRRDPILIMLLLKYMMHRNHHRLSPLRDRLELQLPPLPFLPRPMLRR